MALVNVGTAGTIKSPTVEGQFVQLIEYFQGLEALNGNTTNYVNGDYNSDTLIFAGTFTMPVKFTGVGLNFVGNTEGFLSGAFAPGAGGTFTGTTALDYFLQVVAYISNLQNDKAKNPKNNRNVTATININTGAVSGNFNVPFTRTVTDTGITITPAEYLL